MLKFTNKMILQKMFLLILPMIVAFGVNAHEKPPKEFVHGIEIKLHGQSYYFAGPPDGENGATDVPGHEWLRVGKHRLIGKHYNTGPFGAPNFWSSDAGDGALLYIMDAVIDRWTEKKALQYYMKGFAHYHMLINTKTGERHPNRVVWFKHVAVKDFTFDGAGPLAFGGIEAYSVTAGVDYKMTPNWDTPYNPNPVQ
ncbi:hypothetical protein MNBD_GAMMA17-768 [hydrothermal vent metagenome]|uniref:Uncharacterized protein n=1 Tax=hydrothermal vent metagenome TaxID=652676 RepID=A0A3B0ZKT9_9ZZZZ